MNQAEAQALLDDLAARGVEVWAEGDWLYCRPFSLLSAGDQSRLWEAKPWILARLAPDPHLEMLCLSLPAEDAQDLREERAAILEHLADMPKEKAERRAGWALGQPKE